MQLVWFLVTGAVMGTLSGLLGVGGGIVAVPIMIYCLNMETKMAMGTSLAVIVPVALMGSYKQYVQEHVDIRAALCIAITGILCAYLGAYLNDKIPAEWLRRCFGVLMAVIGIKMIIK